MATHTSYVGVRDGVNATHGATCGGATATPFHLGQWGPAVYMTGASVLSGTAPPGIAPLLCPTGENSNLWMVGTPLVAGVYTYTVRAPLSNGGFFDTDVVHTVTLKPGCALIGLSPSVLGEMSLSTGFAQQMVASNGTGPYTFDLLSGALPPGLTLSAGGLLSGTPTTMASYSFTLRATDAAGCPGVASYSVTVLEFPVPVDYWGPPGGGGGGGGGALGAAVPARMLVVSPNVGTNLSRGKAVTMDGGTPLTHYPATNVVDDSADTVLRVSELIVELFIDLGTAYTPDVFAVLNHNFDASVLLEVQTSDDGITFIPVAAFGGVQPNAWLDLRGFQRTARYWKLRTSTPNTVAISIGEIVIGTALVIEGSLDENFPVATRYFVAREFTEELLPYKMISGARQRRLQLSFVLDPTNRAVIETVFDDAGISGNHVVVVPDTRRNDVYFIEWPSRREITFPQSLREATIQLVLMEQSVGVI